METLVKHPEMTVHAAEPLNIETPLSRLGKSFATVNELFFVRNHGGVPEVDGEDYRLDVSGLVERPARLSLEEIKAEFPSRTTTAAIYCAGNRRAGLVGVAPIPDETPWGAGAVGNARWKGVSLAEVLAAAGVGDGVRHVAFSGLDRVGVGGEESGVFGGSIPIEKATDPNVLLAYEMNGEPLWPEHGFPLRVVVPGYIGARSVKWLSGIELRESPSESPFQAREYRLFPLGFETAPEDPSAGFALGEVPVNAVICAPEDGEELRAGPVVVRGYAIAGGERIVERVDLSADGGETWNQASLFEDVLPGAWRLWAASIGLSSGRHHIVVRAFDSASDTQPEDPKSAWNPKGYLNNARHSVAVNVS